jgi:hypothetical protein
MRAHRLVLGVGALVLVLGAGLATAIVAIATGGSSREAAVFSRTAKLTAARGGVGNGLMLEGSTLVAKKTNGKQLLGSLGGGDEVIAPLTGSLTPVATESSDGAFVVYSSWRQLARIKPDARAQGLVTGQPVGIPSVRLFDVRSGKDVLLANGAASPAVSTGGAIAYFAAESPTVRENVDYTGRVVVADSRDARPRVWTSGPARYFPYAWAGSQLLVYRGIEDSEGTDLYAYSGPDQAQLLAPNAFAIAISPDGSRVLAAVGIRTLEVIHIASGTVEDSLSLDAPAEPGSPPVPAALMYGGSWVGDRIVANSDRGLVVLNVRGGLHIESLFKTPAFPHGVAEPVLVGETHVQGWADLANPETTAGNVDEPAYDNALVDCDLATASCAMGSPKPARKWARWITNPSR